jgi:hypothetical protein
MTDKAAAFLAARAQGGKPRKGKATVRVSEGAMAIVDQWRVGTEHNTVVVTRLLEIADEVLTQLSGNGTAVPGGRA